MQTSQHPISLLDAGEVAEILGISRFIALKWGRDGVLPVVHVGRFVRFRREDIQAFIDGHTTTVNASRARGSDPELSRLMGSSVEMIERTYGHLARDSEQQIRARLDARTRGMGVEWASEENE